MAIRLGDTAEAASSKAFAALAQLTFRGCLRDIVSSLRAQAVRVYRLEICASFAERLIAIGKKRLNLPRSLYENLQLLSLTLCEIMSLDELLAHIYADQMPDEAHDQMTFSRLAL